MSDLSHGKKSSGFRRRFLNRPPPFAGDTTSQSPQQTTNNYRDIVSATPPDPRGSVTRRGLMEVVQALCDCSDIFLPLKTACKVILTIHNTFDRVSTIGEQLKELEVKLETIHSIVANYKQYGGIETLSARIRAFCEAIQLQVDVVQRLRNRSMAARIAESREDANKISKAFRTMGILCDTFQMDTQLNIEKIAGETQKTVGETEKIVKDTDEAVRVIRQCLKSGVIERLRHEMTSYKTRLSSYGDPHGCLAGTRVKILEDLETWALDGDGRKVYWLVGMAGTGKSTISHTLCEILDNENLLGASFFCSRASTKTNNARLIIPTVAYALASASPIFKSKVVEAIEEDDTLPESTYSRLEVQFNKLIRDPLRASLGPDARTYKVVVIDAVDECSNLTVVWSLIILILQMARHIPLKIFITSRNEGPIKRAFDSASSLRERFVLHEVEKVVVEGDIQHYVETSLSQVHSPIRGHTPEAWPSQAEMSTLVSQCGKLFIYAATVIRYITDPCGTPSKRLSNITSQSTGTTSFQSSIDDLYGRILEQACAGRELDEVSETRDLALLIMFLQTPLPIQAIASLSAPEMSTDQLRQGLSPLNSVVYVPDHDDAAVTLFHTSFFDFVTDPTRCTGQRCHSFKALVASEGHKQLVLKCLLRMNASLKYNICCAREEVTTSCRTIANSPNNMGEISEALRYSCLYWAAHLAGVQLQLPCDEIITTLDFFLRTHLLHWIECLSVLGELGSGIQSLQIASTALSRVRSPDHRSHRSHSIVDEALRCLQMSFEAVQKRPMEIYRSSLVWLPKKSLVRKVYHSSVSQAPAITLGLSDTWGPTELTVHSGSPVTAVAYSQDGKRVASGSYDNTVWIRNAITGEVQVKLEGHTGPVWSVAFSEDDNRVISGSEDNTIRIWNADTGKVEVTLEGHTGAVWSAKFSQDGNQVVSGSYDNTIRIWNTTGTMNAKLEGHSGSVWSVASSHDGSRVISGSSDTVGIWNVEACEMVAKMGGVKGSVWSVAFCQESNRVVAGSEDNTVWICNATTGKMLGKLEGHSGSVWSVAFSHDGRRVVSGSSDNTIRIWDVVTGKMEALLEGHTGYVWSVKFSPDSRRVLSGSDDNTLRIWNAATGQIETKVGGRDVPVEFSHDVSASNDTLVHTQNTTTGKMKTKQECHTGRVWSVVFSPDGSRVVSGSDDKTVRIWNAATGATEVTLEGHTGPVKSVAFSPDCSLVVSGSEDTMVLIWKTMTGKMEVKLAGHTGPVLSVTFSYDGGKVISGSGDKTVRIWDVVTGQMEAKLAGHANSVLSVAFSPDGDQAVSGSYDKTVCIWNLKTSKMEVQLKGHTGWVWSVAFTQNGSRVVSGSGDNTVRVWSVKTGEMEEEREAYTGSVSSVAISQDGSRVISGSSDNSDRNSNATMEAKLQGHLDSAKLVALSLDSGQVPGSFEQGTMTAQTTPAGKSPPPPLLFSIAHDRDWMRSAYGDCWIPAHYRDILSSSFLGSRACFGYPDGRVLILDMTVVP